MEAPTIKPAKAASTPDTWAAEFYAAYDHYSKLLRTWLVAYGIGGPVLLLSSEALLQKLSTSGSAKSVAVLFLVGVVLQVLIATINKAVMWVLYYGELHPEYRARTRYELCEWLSEQFALDLVIDIASMVLFALATYETFQLVTSAS
jgi:hypothetical protein